ncbi:SMC family ATPase [Thermocoleostomius sinensis]|nr:SMC family ATPase [Thermocoleostomius sinensis]
MIPQQLTLKNFLSYREATLDFRGFHVACICGANGAGKSSLLEAIVWAIWGQGRATDDDVIHLGVTETLVDFIFQYQHQTYRVIRSRQRGHATTLEFQIRTPNGFRSITEKGVRATQQLILQHLRLDYDTFINSAYLRQGRADEFMLKRPSERKQILSDLLKLEQYDHLAEQAREQARHLKAEINVLEQSLDRLAEQLQQEEALAIEQAQGQARLQQLQQQQQTDETQLRRLYHLQQQRQAGFQQLQLQQQQQEHLMQDCQRVQQELAAAQQQQRQLEILLQDAETIATHYAQFQRLQAEEEVQSAKFQAQQVALAKRQQLQQQQADHQHALQDQRRQAQAQLDAIHQQQQDIRQTLEKTADVEAALEQLRQARARLSELDGLQMKATPLMQRRQQVQTQLDRVQARLQARLEELQRLADRLQQQQQQQPQLQQAVQSITNQIQHLETRRAYQQQVREKGMERRAFLERLQEQQRECERGIAELDHKIAMLSKRGTVELAHAEVSHGAETSDEPEVEAAASTTGLLTLESPRTVTATPHAYPPCPLCDRPLDQHHWQVVLDHHRHEQRELHHQLWVIREQLTTSDREIRILRQEYRDVDKELSPYAGLLERRGQLQQQLQDVQLEQNRLEQITAEIQTLEQTLQQQTFATELHEELQLLDRSLNQLNYDDRDHALIRGEVDRWRWAEIKHAEIKQAQRRWNQLSEQIPALEQTIATLDQQLQTLSTSPLQQQIYELDRHLAAIDYSIEHHTALRQSLRQAQTWQLRYQELLQAQNNYPHMQQKVRELTDLWVQRTQTLQQLRLQEASLAAQLQQTPDPTEQLHILEHQMQQRRIDLDRQLADLGRLQQQQQQLEWVKEQHATLSTQIQTARRQYRIHQELTQAFGRNGIQALMIENVLPQLEAETNQILGRLSANQLHVQFVTQRAKRSGSARSSDKLIDTLDILISDMQGTRPYETYSGGEAFRVNFAIRLALARLLAQRSGMALQLLIVDEGFGTQDEAGCDRLIGALNAIAPDFACILAVTHMPHLKEAFQTRIEVYKTDRGSQLRLVS